MRELLSVLLKSWKLIFRAAPTQAAALVGFVSLAGIAPTLAIWFSAQAIDRLTLALPGTVVPYALAWVGAMALKAVLDPWSTVLQTSLSQHLARRFQISIIEKATSLPGLYAFEDPKFHDRIATLTQGASYRPSQLLLFSVYGLELFFNVVSSLFLVGRVLWWAPILLLLAGLPRAFAIFRLEDAVWEATTGSAPHLRRQRYYLRVATENETAPEVRVFEVGPLLVRKYLGAFNQGARKVLEAQKRLAAYTSGFTLLDVAAAGLVFVVAAGRASMGFATPGDLAVVAQVLLSLQTNLFNLSYNAGLVYENLHYMKDYFRFLKYQDPLAGTSGSPTLSEIRFENVSFTYPGGGEALKGVSLTLRPGEKLAVVGENGAGKTTLVKLLLRFYDPTEGQISVGECDLRDLEPKAWRRKIAALFQNFGRYWFTLAENVAFAEAGKPEARDRVAESLRKAGAEGLLEKTGGWDRELGKPLGGAELSGGEWQRVALARALFKDAEILILDEPTASLDPLMEYEVYKHFAEMARGKTVLFITHRLGSVRMADRILVLDRGRIVEEGSHEELLVKNGLYARLWRAQAEQYN